MSANAAAKAATTQAAEPAWPDLWGEDEKGAYLVGMRCAACGGLALGRREFCPHCHAAGRMRDERIGRTGTLYTATLISQAPRGFNAPYRVGYVDVENGVRVFAHVEAGDNAPALGEKVTLGIVTIGRNAEGKAISGPRYARAARGTK